MKIAVAGKGGAGKTTVAGILARTLARRGSPVLALDCDSNPLLGISLGLGPAETERLIAARQGLEEGGSEHQTTAAGIAAAFGADGPDGLRVVVVSRIDRADPG
jgi:CO dehydrogenase maturation factor